MSADFQLEKGKLSQENAFGSLCRDFSGGPKWDVATLATCSLSLNKSGRCYCKIRDKVIIVF